MAREFTTPITLPGDPVNLLEATPKQYVDARVDGGLYLAPARIATTANLNLATTGLAAIDGVTPIAGNRVLVKDQTTKSENGVYVAASTAWTRATDADLAAEVTRGTRIRVTEGTANKFKTFTQLDVVTTIGTDTQTWRVLTFIDVAGFGTMPPAMGTGHIAVHSPSKMIQYWNGSAFASLSGVYTCTSSTRPTFINDDTIIYETDTKLLYLRSGGAWVPVNGLTVQDENATVGTASSIVQLDFQGAGVSVAAGSAGEMVVTVPGGGGGLAPGSVGNTELAANAVTTDKISDGTIVAGDLASSLTAMLVPTGCIMMWPTATPPTGWLLCNGQSTSGFTALAALVGATVPDMQAKFPIGAGTLPTSGSVVGLNSSGGADQRTIAPANLPAHQHTIDVGTTAGTVNNTLIRGNSTSVAATISLPVGSGPGSSTALNTIPPYYAVNYIIKT